MMSKKHQLKYIQFLNLLNCKNFFSNVKSSVISPLLNFLCIITDQNNAVLYSLPNSENSIEHIWKCSPKVQRCLFSEDGKSILLILIVNSLQIYSINDNGVKLLNQIRASELAKILQNNNLDFSAGNHITPLKVFNDSIIILLDKNTILNIEWNSTNLPNVKYSIYLNQYLDIQINKEFIFVLTNTGFINGYDINCGNKYHDLELPVYSVGQCFKFCIHTNSKLVAVVNQFEETILLDINDFFISETDNINSVKETKIDIKNWSYKGKKKKNLKTDPCKIMGKVSPPPGVSVLCLQFSIKGLFVFYNVSGESECTSFTVIDENSAVPLYNFNDLVASKVLCGGPLPLVMSDSILSLCLGSLYNDYFIIKLCETVTSFSFSKEIERTLFNQPRTEIFNFHVSFLNIMLDFHLNIFLYNLNFLIAKKKMFPKINLNFEKSLSEQKIMEKLYNLFNLVLKVEDDVKPEGINAKQIMLIKCFLHSIRLLDLVQNKMRHIFESELYSNLLKQTLILFESIKITDPLENKWISWRSMSDAEIIQETMIAGTISLAHVFLVTHRAWSVNEVEKEFITKAHKYIRMLISKNEVKKAEISLSNLGFDSLKYMKSLCLSTNNILLRDKIVKYLHQKGEFTLKEIIIFDINKKIENAMALAPKRCYKFCHESTFSGKEKINNVVYKHNTYNNVIDFKTFLDSTENWCSMVLTEVYFTTGDSVLEKFLQKELCWRYLVEVNQVNLLQNWIKNLNKQNFEELSDYVLNSFICITDKWNVTEDMFKFINNVKCMTLTKNIVFDNFAFYGYFSEHEKNNLKNIVGRVENNSKLTNITKIFSKPTSNIKIRDFENMIFRDCINYSLKPVILICLNDNSSLKNSIEFQKEFSHQTNWIEIWSVFISWDKNKENKILFRNAVKESLKVYNCNAEEMQYIKTALVLLNEKNLKEVYDLSEIPFIKEKYPKIFKRNTKGSDVTIYDLLFNSNVPVAKIFSWQSSCWNNKTLTQLEVLLDFPHFNHQILEKKFGFKQNLGYVYYLKQGRPSFACNFFVVESLRTHRRLTTKMVKRVCGVAQGLALRYWKNESLGASCIALIVMLGNIGLANILRIYMQAIECICTQINKYTEYHINTLVCGVAKREISSIQEMAIALEMSVANVVDNEEDTTQLKKWCLAVCFCNMHNLSLPSLLLKQLAKNHNWFSFIICLDIFKYPYEQAIELIEEIESKVLKSHLLRALTRTTLKLSTSSPSKSAPKILLEPNNNGKDDFEIKDTRDIFQAFVTNVYTEVINTIQTFTDKNIVLPWSCEQNPDQDVLLTLLKCESEPDACKSLLISAIELQSPVLAILGECFQPGNYFSIFMVWFVSSIPTSMPRIKRKEEGSQILDRLCCSKDLETSFINFFCTGYFQTFFRGMSLFMPENPFTLFFNAVNQGIVLLDFESSLQLIKEFTFELAHFRSREPNDFFSKSWILNALILCIENLLVRNDLRDSIKKKFLDTLAQSDFSTSDSSIPNYLLLSQLCGILESSETKVNFIDLYKMTNMSEESMKNLDRLLENHQFTQALEICSLLGLNKDKVIISMWKYQIESFIKKDEGINIEETWRESSLAFKDENVNPNLAALFYFNMANNFKSLSSNSLKNRFLALEYCLHWRRLMPDAISASFLEESDSIELEKWKCSIEPNFDIKFLKNFYSVNFSCSVLNMWPLLRISVPAQTLDKTKNDRANLLINMFLDQNDFQHAYRLGSFFKNENQNLSLITLCLKVIHDKISPSELPEQSELWEVFLTTSTELQFENESVSSFKQKIDDKLQTISFLNQVYDIVKTGKTLVKKILVCYSLSVEMDSTFEEIACERDFLSLFQRSTFLEGTNKLKMADDLITLANLSDIETAKFLKDKLVAVLMEYCSSDLSVPPTLWNVSLNSNFHSIVKLTNDPSLLGFELLRSSVTLPCVPAIEILIKAHDCFTMACNLEGIGKVLRRSRILASIAFKEGEWQNLIRLLFGIKRFMDMSYIFQTLKECGQFERLIHKGFQKVPGLQKGILDYLKMNKLQDWDLGKSIVAHFNFYSELAAFRQNEGDNIISKLLNSKQILSESNKKQNLLNTAMDHYFHAAHLFLQANKMKKALNAAYRAQMVAMQISLIDGPLILNLEFESRLYFQNVIMENLTVAQTILICRAYNLEPNWEEIVYDRCLLKEDKIFCSDLWSVFILSPQLIKSRSLRYDLEQIKNVKGKEKMKHLTIESGQSFSPLHMDLCKTDNFLDVYF